MNTKCDFNEYYDLVVDENIFTLQTKEVVPVPYTLEDKIQSMLEADSILKRIITIDKETFKKIHSRKYSKSVILFSTSSTTFLSPTKEILEENFSISQGDIEYGFPVCLAKKFLKKEGTYTLDSFLYLSEEQIKITFTEEVQKGYLDIRGKIFYRTILSESISFSPSYTYDNLQDELIHNYYTSYARRKK
jgi:hypothetical protein